MNVIEPNYFKMRLKDDFPLWKRIVWRTFGTKSFGSAQGYYVEGYWLRGTCLITKFIREIGNDQK
jgi:hypothetical protein